MLHKLNVWDFYSNLIISSDFGQNRAKITGTAHENLPTVLQLAIRISYASDRLCCL